MMRLCLMVTLLGWFACSVAAFAAQGDSTGVSDDFFTSGLALKTDTGSINLKIRVSEFLAGIQTPKNLDKRGPRLWVLQTEYQDPVVNTSRVYILVFQKVNGTVVLDKVSFDGRVYSQAEMRAFAEQVIRNYSEHTIVK